MAIKLRRGPKPMYSDAQWEWVAQRYSEGYSKLSLATFLGLSEATVRNKMSELDAHRTPYPDLNNYRAEFNALRIQEVHHG